MQHLCFFRHGIAIDRADPASPAEEDRQLTGEGEKKTKLAAQGLRRMKLPFDIILTSPWLRAAQTAAILSKTLEMPAPEELQELAGNHTANELIKALAARFQGQNVLLVGHEPLLSTAAVRLLGGRWQLDLGKSGACAIELDGIPSQKPATLLWLMTPRQLRWISAR